MNVTDYFDRARIINIASRKDRRVETVQEFARNGFPFDHEKVSFFQAVTPSEDNGFPSIGARGCFMSHLGILEEAIRLNVKNILILEWDIAYFGHPFEGDSSSPTWKAVDQPIHLSHFYAVNGKCITRLRDFLLQILERPPGHPDGGPMHYDAALNTLIHSNKDVQAYYFTWNLGYQRPSRTDLHALSLFDRTPVLRDVMGMLRKLKAMNLRRIR
jgi:hypothetical protein